MQFAKKNYELGIETENILSILELALLFLKKTNKISFETTGSVAPELTETCKFHTEMHINVKFS